MTTTLNATVTDMIRAAYQVPELGDVFMRFLKELEGRSLVIEVKDDATMAYANDTMAISKRLLRRFEEERTRRVGPHVAAQKTINNSFKAVTDPITAIKDHAANAIKEYLRKKEADSKKEIENMQATATQLSQDLGVTITPDVLLGTVETRPAPITSASGTTSARKVWKARVVDLQEFIEYVALHQEADPSLHSLIWVDVERMNQKARETQGSSPYPGIEFYEDIQLTTR